MVCCSEAHAPAALLCRRFFAFWLCDPTIKEQQPEEGREEGRLQKWVSNTFIPFFCCFRTFQQLLLPLLPPNLFFVGDRETAKQAAV
jgi:hypothetical protein